MAAWAEYMATDVRMAVISTDAWMIRGSGGSGNKKMHSYYLRVNKIN